MVMAMVKVDLYSAFLQSL